MCSNLFIFHLERPNQDSVFFTTYCLGGLENKRFTPTARPTALFFGGNGNLEEWLTEKLFGTFDDPPLSDEEQNPHKELARYSDLLDSGAACGVAQAHESLEFYLKTWARRLEDDGSVTSPFMAFIFDPGS